MCPAQGHNTTLPVGFKTFNCLVRDSTNRVEFIKFIYYLAVKITMLITHAEQQQKQVFSRCGSDHIQTLLTGLDKNIFFNVKL